MKIPRPPHNWSVTPREAIAIQHRLARSVRQARPSLPLRYIAGVDAAFSPDNARCLAGVVLWDRSRGEVIERRTASRPLTFPYIPGLLTFREAPAIIAALRKLDRPPDCLLCDGQGIAHPRRCGIASHLGLLAGLPAIGCAKTRLLGDCHLPAPSMGARSPLLDNGEVIGTVLRTRDRVKPVYVSVGHAIDLDTAAAVILDCCRGYRLPEPARLAHQLAGRVLRQRQHRPPFP